MQELRITDDPVHHFRHRRHCGIVFLSWASFFTIVLAATYVQGGHFHSWSLPQAQTLGHARPHPPLKFEAASPRVASRVVHTRSPATLRRPLRAWPAPQPLHGAQAAPPSPDRPAGLRCVLAVLVGIIGFVCQAWVRGLGHAPPLAAAAALSIPAQTPITASPPASLTNAPQRVAVVGGGPAGLALALGLAHRGWPHITVLDKRPAPPAPDDRAVFGDNSRHYMIGISGRGQLALGRLGVMPALDQHACLVRGRMDWTPETGTALEAGRVTETAVQKGYVTRTIQRDRLAAVLHQEVLKHADRVTLRYDTAVQDVQWAQDGSTATLVIGETGDQETYDLVVGADGVGSIVRDALERDGELKVQRFPDDNVRLYKTIPMHFPAGWRKDLNYSCRTASGLNLDALPTAEGAYIGVLLFRPGCPRIAAARDAPSARRLFQEHFPMFAPHLEDADLAVFAEKEPSRLPIFRSVKPRLHRRRGGACVMGDSIHTVKPFFGLGVNSAFEDVSVFMDCLAQAREAPSKALPLFSEARANDAEALVRLSRQFDRPGLGQFVSFLLPIILDGIFSKACPAVFAPNPLRLLQDPNLSFSQVARRKRRDRILQVAVLVAGLGAAVWAGALACRALLPLLLQLLP